MYYAMSEARPREGYVPLKPSAVISMSVYAGARHNEPRPDVSRPATIDRQHTTWCRIYEEGRLEHAVRCKEDVSRGSSERRRCPAPNPRRGFAIAESTRHPARINERQTNSPEHVPPRRGPERKVSSPGNQSLADKRTTPRLTEHRSCGRSLRQPRSLVPHRHEIPCGEEGRPRAPGYAQKCQASASAAPGSETVARRRGVPDMGEAAPHRES
ncbi:hypothetical protein C8Q79DRAFT_147755 [Trametes meyenii]|nr:hypothetical protein C8Q79DRAFT_147755 [Trametes meyenii]